MQAIGLTAPDLPPVPGKASAVGRDCEYVRHGTVSVLAGIDLHCGHIFANVEDRQRSVAFIALLKQLDPHYPEEAIIRVVLDNPAGCRRSLYGRWSPALSPGQRFQSLVIGDFLASHQAIVAAMKRVRRLHAREHKRGELRLGGLLAGAHGQSARRLGCPR